MPKKLKAAAADASALAGTLEEYFATHRGSGEVSSHLLIGTPTHNALASEPIESEGVAEPSAPGLDEAADASHSCDAEQQHGAAEASDSGASHERDEVKPPEYTQAGGAADDTTDGSGGKKRSEKSVAKPKPKPKSIGAVVPGMSLDSYLGVAPDAGDGVSEDTSSDEDAGDEDKAALLAGKKKAKKAASPPKESSKKTSKSKPLAPPASPPPEDSATPFQRHQKRKQHARTKLQQQHATTTATAIAAAEVAAAGPVSRAILMAEPLAAVSVHEAARSNRRRSKATHQPQAAPHQPSPSQSPLPKLAASPLVAHSSGATDHSHFGPSSSIASAIGAHHQSSNSGSNSGSSGDATTSTDKLPPL